MRRAAAERQLALCFSPGSSQAFWAFELWWQSLWGSFHAGTCPAACAALKLAGLTRCLQVFVVPWRISQVNIYWWSLESRHSLGFLFDSITFSFSCSSVHFSIFFASAGSQALQAKLSVLSDIIYKPPWCLSITRISNPRIVRNVQPPPPLWVTHKTSTSVTFALNWGCSYSSCLHCHTQNLKLSH